jgi:hypothetical protein
LPAERIAGRVEWNAYAIRERNGTEWWSGSRWTPASDEARQFASEALAEAEGEDRCDARDWIVVEIEAE